MAVYRTTWTFSTLLAGAVGVWVGVRVWSFGGALLLFLFVAVAAASIRLSTTREGEPPPWRRAARTGLAWGAGVLATGGLMSWLGIQGLSVIAVLTLSSPAVWTHVPRLVRRRTHGARPEAPHSRSGPTEHPGQDRAGPPRPHRDPVPAVTSLMEAPWMTRPAGSMDDRALCSAWRTSYVALQQPLTLPCRVRVVDRRQEFLDELERRNPRGLEAWLASGARAAGDPTRFITSGRRRLHRRDDRR